MANNSEVHGDMSFLRIVLLGLLGPVLMAATDIKPAKKVSSDELIDDLGDERYPVRVNASHELWQRGSSVVDLLKQAEASEAVEVALRARVIRRKIELGIYPDSPPAIVDLVTAYDGAPKTQRVEIIQELKQLEAWPQVLRLNALERDPEVRAMLSEHLEGVAVHAARAFLMREQPDFEEAREMLELGPANPNQLLALASLHRSQGTLEKEMERAGKLEGKRGHMWRYALHAVAAQPIKAADEAEAAEEFLIAARLRLLAGDPRDYLLLAPVPDQEIPPVHLDNYRDAVLARWHGESIPDTVIESIQGSIRDAQEDDTWRSLRLLYALGQTGKADPIFERLNAADAFFYYQASERIDDAIESLGLDPDEPDYVGWLEQRMKRVAAQLGDAQADLSALKYLAYFLEQRGLRDELREGLAEPLIELSKSDSETFLNVISMLFPDGQQMYSSNLVVAEPVIESAAAYIGEDEMREDQIITRLFGEMTITQDVLNELDTFRPELEAADRLRWLAVLFGRIPDREGWIDEWWKWLENKRAELEGNQLAHHLGLMVTYAMYETDANKFLELIAEVREAGISLDQLGKFSSRFAFQRFEWQCLISFGRYEELLDRLKKQFNNEPDQLTSKAYLAAALRGVGDVEKAREIEKEIDLLMLSDVNSMRRVAAIYEEFGSFKRAEYWWHRVLMESSHAGSEYVTWGQKLAEAAKERGDWTLVASLTEMILLHQVMTGDELAQPAIIARLRIEADMAWALDRLEDNRSEALARLERCYQIGLTDGSMADYFFPAIREAGLTDWHDRWFESSWKSLSAVIDRFPNSHNTLNTLAWTAARASRRLDEAEELSRRSIELMPGQAAYLDTMAEIQFAQHRREKAIEWGNRAVSRQPYGTPIIRQFMKFREGSFPVE